MDTNGCAYNECPRVIEVWDNVRQQGAVAVQTYRFGPGEVPDLVPVPPTEHVGWMTREEFERFAGYLAQQTAPTSFADLLRGAHRSLFRLETLPQYQVASEQDLLAAFRDGRPQPEPTEGARAFLAEVSADVARGLRRQRVRLVGEPLSEYEKWEVGHAYRLNAQAGEDIRIAARARIPGLEDWRRDFYLLDGLVAVLIHYDDDGRLLSGWRTNDPDIVHPCRIAYDEALAAAVPRDYFLSRTLSAEPATS